VRRADSDAEPGPEGRCPTPRMQTLVAEAVAPARALSDAPAGVIAGSDPDAELVARWQGGDLRAFETLVRRHERRVFRLLYRMLGSREEAEDATQEAFLSLHRHGHRFRREARFSTFLYRVAANAALNRRRSLGRARARAEEFGRRHQVGDEGPTTLPDPEAAVQGAQVQVAVQQALLELAPDLRMAVVLFDIEGRAYKEIADVLGIPEGTVKSRIHRGRSALRESLRGVLDRREPGEKP
jgi:RNA polymerase sigma-70 factor, ECF subfamily